ncbi:uncharacterized protein LOC127868025 isoform X2 [Dreissena polymorpha]|uniref:uncharacterized protein LOC127868025 isoform X2 n=1 Tax=Dreissena polymorpha TaxID=45954 RepID=UPI002263D1DC|nr:uncharacterized protein LOC127868025 isoform X2 [Dreissena polymorpha]
MSHHARQMEPLYFYSLRKVHIFGVRIDGQRKHINFLVDEDQTIGQDGSQAHGPDSVISMLDWVMANYETENDVCSIHADNCTGQNKNKFVVGYLMWRVMTGKHRKIEYQMQIPGHARCLVDSGFAHIKIKYHCHDCETREQLAEIVEGSSIGNMAVSYPQLSCRAWKEFLGQHFKPVIGISTLGLRKTNQVSSLSKQRLVRRRQK